MKAIILAAGRGSRLHPYTADCPKCLTELGGMTLIDHQLSVLRDPAFGIDEIIIVTGYRSEMLALPGTAQVHNADWETTNMVESLFVAESLFGDDFILAYSDIIYDPKVLRMLVDCDAEIAVIVDQKWRAYWEFRFDDPLSDAESLRVNDKGHIIDIGQKVKNINAIEGQYIGLMRFRGKGVHALQKARQELGDVSRPWMTDRPLHKAYMTDLLMELILRDETVTAVPIESGWLEIDTVQDLENAAAGFRDGTINKFFPSKEA